MAAKVKFTSPFGVARYPHITKPDSTGQYADNKYKTKLVLPIDDPNAKAFMKMIDEAAVQLHGAKGAKLYKPYEVDEEADEVVFKFKTQYAPAIFDSRNKPLNGKSVTVGGGSVIRLCGQIVAFDKGITAQFNQVQVRELTSFGQSAFDEVEGGFSGEDLDDADDTSDFDTDDADDAPRSSLDL